VIACPSHPRTSRLTPVFDEPVFEVTAKQKMVEPETGILLPAHALVVPECVDALIRMEMTEGVRPAAADEPAVGGAAFRVDQRVVVLGRGRIDVEIGRCDIVVARTIGAPDLRSAVACFLNLSIQASL